MGGTRRHLESNTTHTMDDAGVAFKDSLIIVRQGISSPPIEYPAIIQARKGKGPDCLNSSASKKFPTHIMSQARRGDVPALIKQMQLEVERNEKRAKAPEDLGGGYLLEQKTGTRRRPNSFLFQRPGYVSTR